jgi:uncharacterized protein YndB with AHSA1/START domain
MPRANDAPFGSTFAELEGRFARADAGSLPEGRSRGTALVLPASAIGRLIAGIVRLLFWQGKVFDADRRRLRNILSPASVLAVEAEVYEDESWFDHRPCIVLDYARTSRIASWIRDEIREVELGRYLGLIFVRGRRLPFGFWLSFPASGEMETPQTTERSFPLDQRDAAWAHEAPIRIQRVVDLPCSCDEAFAVLADHERWPSWFTGMRRVRIDGAAAGVDALRTVWVGPARVQERFVVWEAPHRLSFSIVASNLPGLEAMVEDWVLTERNGACRLTITIGAEAKKAVGAAAPLLREVLVRSTAGATGVVDALG